MRDETARRPHRPDVIQPSAHHTASSLPHIHSTVRVFFRQRIDRPGHAELPSSMCVCVSICRVVPKSSSHCGFDRAMTTAKPTTPPARPIVAPAASSRPGKMLVPAVLAVSSLSVAYPAVMSELNAVYALINHFGDVERAALHHSREIAVVTVLFMMGFAAFNMMAISYCRAKSKRTEYAARLISLAHAVGSVILCGAVLRCRVSAGSSLRSGTCVQEAVVLCFSIAYFVVDSVGILCNDYFDVMFLLHHVGCIAALAWCVTSGVAGYFIALILFCMELTNPLMHTHWINVEDKRTTGRLYALNRITFIFSYLVMRVFIGAWLLYQMTTHLRDLLPLWIVLLAWAITIFSIRLLVCIVKAELRGDQWIS
jgi:hypothetical protein